MLLERYWTTTATVAAAQTQSMIVSRADGSLPGGSTFNIEYEPTSVIINVASGGGDAIVKLLSKNQTDAELNAGMKLFAGREYIFSDSKDFYSKYEVIGSGGTVTITVSASRYLKAREMRFNGILEENVLS